MLVDLFAVADVLRVLRPRAERCGAELLVVGAAARDILLTTPPLRQTNDIDFGLGVDSAERAAEVMHGLQPIDGHVNKFTIAGFEVDLVAFGGVEEPDRSVLSRDGFRMSVLGYREALAAAADVVLPDGHVARVASLPAQVVLKLAAWEDRRHVTTKDAVDLCSLLHEYREPAYVGEMFEEHGHRMARQDFDPALAAADRMGAEGAALLGAGAARVVALLERECARDGALPVDMTGDAAGNRALLRALLQGIREG